MEAGSEWRGGVGGRDVEENLILAGLTAPHKWPLDRSWEMFPRLKQRRTSRGTDLSGGEQQMLAIARALIRDPKIILLDEPFEGLAPLIVKELVHVCRDLAAAGLTIVLVTHEAEIAMYAERIVVLADGVISSDRRRSLVGPTLLREYGVPS